jgi:PAS domain S-box-containing protein
VEVLANPLQVNELTSFRQRINSLEKLVADLQQENANLRASQTLFQQVLDHSPAVISVKDLKGRYLLVNKHAANLMELEPAQMIGASEQTLLPPEVLAAWRLHDQQILTQGKPIQTEEVIRFEEAIYFYFALKFPLFDAQGQIYAIGNIATDFTERKQVERSLRESKDRLQRKLDLILSSQEEVEMEGIKLLDLIELEELQKMQDLFAKMTGVASIIADTEGKPITEPSNFCGVCTIVRATPKGQQRCVTSDGILGQKAREAMKPTYQKCLSCGFVDASAPIVVGGKHVANWLIGQSNPMGVTRAEMQVVAQEIEADEAALLAAYDSLPAMPFERFEQILAFLWMLAEKIATLGYHNLKLARELTKHRQFENILRENEERYRSLVELSPDGIAIHQGGKFVYINSAGLRILGAANLEEARTKTVLEYVHPDYQQLVRERIQKTQGEGENTMAVEERFVQLSGKIIPVEVNSTPITYNGHPASQVIVRDISYRKQIETALRERSTPLLPLAENILAMPLIGQIDSERAQQATEVLLQGISAQRAKFVILDITGVPAIDTNVANALLQTAQAVKLLGAKAILTGITPAMAQTLVHLGLDLKDIITYNTFQSGIAYALKANSLQNGHSQRNR